MSIKLIMHIFTINKTFFIWLVYIHKIRSMNGYRCKLMDARSSKPPGQLLTQVQLLLFYDFMNPQKQPEIKYIIRNSNVKLP